MFRWKLNIKNYLLSHKSGKLWVTAIPDRIDFVSFNTNSKYYLAFDFLGRKERTNLKKDLRKQGFIIDILNGWKGLIIKKYSIFLYGSGENFPRQ